MLAPRHADRATTTAKLQYSTISSLKKAALYGPLTEDASAFIDNREFEGCGLHKKNTLSPY